MRTQQAVLNRLRISSYLKHGMPSRSLSHQSPRHNHCLRIFIQSRNKQAISTNQHRKIPAYMLSISRLALAILLLSDLSSLAQTRAKLRRSESFFGVHFDLHATEDITDAGRTLTPAMVDSFLRKVRPDFIQIDCKGHPGITSYPTKAGYHVKGFDKDPLRIFRDVTEKNRVGLYMHYSGVWDGKVATAHPDWAMVRARK